ncbi:MAG: Uma2 family endonuclease [Candidatus Symbiothrix sp.]|jgi:Uma2 family endonuclease|nr:Uma2 family endonuclease [Candidatus Symbiothrix sp.]
MGDLKESKPYLIPDEGEEPDELESDRLCEPAITYGSHSIRYSYADYLTWLDDKRREIIDGIVHLMTAARTRHAKLSYRCIMKLGYFVEKRKGSCQIFPAPFDVRFPKNNITDDNKIYTVLQPDIVVVCDPSKIDEKGCIGAPDIVVEILSKSTARYDMTTKFQVYQEAGVREYWTVHQKKQQVTIYALQTDGLYDEGVVFQEGDKLSSNVLKGLRIDINELFKDLYPG